MHVSDLNPCDIILNNSNNYNKKKDCNCVSIYKIINKIYDNIITYLSDFWRHQTCNGDNDHDNNEDSSLTKKKSTYRLDIMHRLA